MRDADFEESSNNESHPGVTVQCEPKPLNRKQWCDAIDADGGNVVTVDDGVTSWNITPAYLGFDHVDMIDWQMRNAAATGRLWPETRDAFLDARIVWSALERAA